MSMLRNALVIGTVAALGIAGCKAADAPAPQQTEAGAVATPDAKPGVSAGGGRLVLPVIPGRPGVAYFRVSNNSAEPITLAAVHIRGVGKAEMHRTTGGKMAPAPTVPVAAGASVAFAPGGLHVMAFDIDKALKAGGESELTLTFADGDKISIPAKVEAMGEAAGEHSGMAGMSH